MKHIDHIAVQAIIDAFTVQIRVQEGHKKMGLKHMVDELKEDLALFANYYDYEECRDCGQFSDDVIDDVYERKTCAACQKKDGTAIRRAC